MKLATAGLSLGLTLALLSLVGGVSGGLVKRDTGSSDQVPVQASVVGSGADPDHMSAKDGISIPVIASNQPPAVIPPGTHVVHVADQPVPGSDTVMVEETVEEDVNQAVSADAADEVQVIQEKVDRVDEDADVHMDDDNDDYDVVGAEDDDAGH